MSSIDETPKKRRRRLFLNNQPVSRPISETTRKRIFQPVSTRPLDPSLRGPRRQLVHRRTGRSYKEKAIECAGIALSSWNEKSLSEQGPEYKLVKALGCMFMVGPCTYHLNFIAKPKKGRKAENMLFFAEIQYSGDYENGALGCNVCCILGTSDTETGLCGCEICASDPFLVQHPENGDFSKGPQDAQAKIMAKYRQQSSSKSETESDGCDIEVTSQSHTTP